MSFKFTILSKEAIDEIIPLVEKLNNNSVSDDVLKQRFTEMFSQNYECAGVYFEEKLIGICGLWYCTRHYSGKSVEVDHVYIKDDYQGKGLGKVFFKWIYDYVKTKDCESIELNTYVGNSDSHKFYFNEGYKILGYHFFKKL